MYHLARLFIMSKKLSLFSCIVSVMFIVCSSHPFLQSEPFQDPEIIASADAGSSVHEGNWASYKQTPLESYCYGGMAYDTENDYIAVPECDSWNYNKIDVTIRHNSDWNTVIETLETNIQSLRFLEFSPNGKYLLILDYDFEIYSTQNWEKVYFGDISTTDGSYYPAYDITWSGDGERLVISTGNDGGKMYEGPDWDEVTGTTSTGYYVAHHPSEDTLWYMTTDGAVSEYELQNVPFVGDSWVQIQTYTVGAYNTGRMSISQDGDMIVAESWGDLYVYSSSTFQQEFYATGSNPVFSSTGTHLLYQTYEGYEIYSTDMWSKTSEIEEETGSYNTPTLSFTSEDDEIVVFLDGRYYSEYSFMAIKPDSDSDGVVDELDLCTDTPSEENSDIRGCAPSQKDTDLDGINDRDDLCPRTNTASTVDASGCSEEQLTDSDGDGISDSDDQCPSTPIDEYSNIYGCSSSQRDVDGDGTTDSNDECPLHNIDQCPNIMSWAPNIEPVDNTEDYSNPQWSPNGDLLATFDDSESIHILNTDFSIEYEITNELTDTYFSKLLWLPDGNSILALWANSSYYQSTCGYSIFMLSNLENPTHNTISNSCDYIRALAISPDGNELAVSIFSYDEYSGKMMTIDLSTGVQGLEDEDYYPRQLEYSHDGTTLVGFTSGDILMWDTFDGYLLRSKGINSINSFHQSPDGDWLIVSTEEEIKLYSFNTLVFKDSISIGRNNSDYIYDNIDGLSLSRNGNLIYASISERYYDIQNEAIWSNVTIHTYAITESNELEFLVKSTSVNESNWMVTSISPDESMAIVRLSSVYGFTIWTKDSDGDGIVDTQDLCQETPIASDVNEDGCSQEQRDDDEDGVANSHDLCPASPYGIPVDQNGCTDQQVDQDFDGVCDAGAPSYGPSICVGEDKCPGSPSGTETDANGCTWSQQDSDGDGVNNGDDQCAETEIAGDADANGCDRKQRDTDNDSIYDYWDLCEQTLFGEVIDDVGCSDAQVDSDMDTVCDRGATSTGPSNCTSTDTCPNTEANESVDGNGCSWNQKDDDVDGVLNKFDVCPGTLADAVAPNGCSTWQIDTDGDGVNDANDACANTNPLHVSDSKGCSSEQNELIEPSSSSSFLTSTTLVGAAGVVVVLLITLLFFRRKESVETLEESEVRYPQYATRGTMREGLEWIEHPTGSQQWFYRDPSTQQWVHRK